MPNPKQVMENPQQKRKVKFYHVQEEEAEQLYQGSLQETYRHNMEQSRFYKKKAREKNQIPPNNGSFSGFKKVFKALGRFLTGTPNYYELYNKIDSRWEAYNLSEVSHNLEEGSNHILEENSNRDPMTQKVTLQKAGVYQAFTNMAEHGEFFDAVEGDKVLMNLQGDAFSFEERDEQLSDNEKQALRDATAAREDLARFLEQLKQFKEAHGKLSPENLSKLRSTYLEKKEGSKFSPCGKYIFELVTGVEANKESLDYASKNHPDLLQMIIYTQILNQMDLAIHQMLIPKQLGNDSVLLNLEQYAHLQAQKKETNRLLTELMNKTDIRTEFKNKFESDAQKDALKDKSKKAGAEKTSEKNKDGNEQEGKEANLSTDKKFMTLYTEYSKLAGDNKDAKKQFLIKNLKTLLAAAAEISKNQSNEEKADENGVVAPLSVIKDTVSKIANDPFAYDYFADDMDAFDQLMNATACMIPDSEISKTMDKAELVKKINNFYPSGYNLVKQDLANHFVSNLEDAEVVQVEDDKEQKYHSIMLEFYDGFHSKKLEKYNPLFSVVKKISYDPKAYKALLDAPIAKKEFISIRNLISTDYALHILEGQQLQKDQYYKNLERAAQELDSSLPVLKTWYKKYTKDLTQKEKEEVTASLKEQIKNLKNPDAPQDEKTDAGKQDSAKDKVKENASDKTKKFLDTLKEFIAKNPVNDKDENAEIYSRIYETLANPQIEVVMKQPKALQDVLNLSHFILKGNQAVTDSAYNSYSTLTQTLQAEQERLKAEQSKKELHDEIQGAVSKEKALERINDQIEILKKKAKNPHSILNTQKLINSLMIFIDKYTVISKDAKDKNKKQITKEEILSVLKYSPKSLKHPETLKSLLEFADSITKNQSLTDPKEFAQSWRIAKDAIAQERKVELDEAVKEKDSKNINKQPLLLDPKNLPRTFEEMEKIPYTVTPKMEADFLAIQTDLCQRSKWTEVINNSQKAPEYYVSYSQLYDKIFAYPDNVLLVKLINLLKCNDSETLIRERSKLYAKFGEKIDIHLYNHLKQRAALLEKINQTYAKQKINPCPIEPNSFNPYPLETQIEKPINICWSIGLSNLLACQGIRIPSQYIRAARKEDANFFTNSELKNPYMYESTIYSQSSYGQFGSVKRGFDQISYLDVVKNYDCVESNFAASEKKATEKDWYDWFISKLEEAFGGNDFNKNHSSAMTFTNDKHVITILGFDNLISEDPEKIILYVHDSLDAQNTIHPMTLKQLKQTQLDKENKTFNDTGICYLKKKEQSKPQQKK